MTTPWIAVLVTGEPVAEARARRGTFVDLIRQAAPDFGTLRWVACDARELDVLPDLTAASAVIVTGSAASVMDGSPWIARASQCVRQLVLAEVPLLGICFGHQLLGHALGGRVSLNPRGREIGSVPMLLELDDAVLGKRGTRLVNMTHLDSVVELPPGAAVLGCSEREPHAAVRFGARAWGVQFHPEIDAEVLRYYFAARRAALLAEGMDVAAGESAVVDAPEARLVIDRFLRLALPRGAAPG